MEMNEFDEILTFSAHDTRALFLKDRLKTQNVEFLWRETTAYNEPGYELKIRKKDLEKVDLILRELSRETGSADPESPSVFGKIRKLTGFMAWTTVLLTIAFLVYIAALISKGELPQIAWSAVIFMVAVLVFYIYYGIKNRN